MRESCTFGSVGGAWEGNLPGLSDKPHSNDEEMRVKELPTAPPFWFTSAVPHRQGKQVIGADFVYHPVAESSNQAPSNLVSLHAGYSREDFGMLRCNLEDSLHIIHKGDTDAIAGLFVGRSRLPEAGWRPG